MLLYHKIPGFNLGSITFSTTTINQAGTTTITQANGTTPNFTSYDYYVLSLINKDRNQYGLGNVTLSSTSSGQQHTQSMLNYHYFSHWDIYGLKPYMRYTLLGGLGAVSENIAFNTELVPHRIVLQRKSGRRKGAQGDGVQHDVQRFDMLQQRAQGQHTRSAAQQSEHRHKLQLQSFLLICIICKITFIEL